MENNKLDMNLQLLADNEGGEESPQDNHIDNTTNGEGVVVKRGKKKFVKVIAK